ncbi:phosphoribosyltransferase [Phycicoccus endophyticus]|uniref:Phosphoribosyltransferase n=1 Tax=Phycicoccus endophyticus TaxID=1690220 RepID=A0A7G9QY69_9MICO|nr:phosphoribosyltransferase [Phycicoccus endophyticus]NHI19181.1 phosphoribosyltransferase [Phycicoccus endophyticus]QNN48294.1 phosphoribosyltransferase [Phycicoccus endophyticus]GGL40802.1 phosphoribosyltransferase [Phycicoccus endophyticus]
MDAEREVLTWAAFDEAVWSLAERVAGDGVPDAVLAVARGGLVVGGALAYATGVKCTPVLNVELYTGVDERLPEPRLVPPVPDLGGLAGADVLVADDVADTGLTLVAVRDFLAGRVGRVRTAVVYEKPGSLVRPDYTWGHTDRWVTFPWSDREPVCARSAATA